MADDLDPGWSLQRPHEAVLRTEPGKQGLCWPTWTCVSRYSPATAGPQTFYSGPGHHTPKKPTKFVLSDCKLLYHLVSYVVHSFRIKCPLSSFLVIFLAISFREWV